MTRQIRVGKIKIGGGAPIAIQSMAKTDTRDAAATARQIRGLEKAGCEIVRVAVKDLDAARAIRDIKKKINIPLCADIHFDYRLAISAMENGADKIRINPGNVRKKEDIAKVARMAKRKKIPIRVGVNSGSINAVDGMVKAALDCIKVLEREDFYDIIVSLKASDVVTTVEAYRKFAKRSDCPLHLGVTAAGPASTGLIKSSIGIGALLLDGIGDTIRVSLTGDPREEVAAAKNILQALGLRRFGPEIISCPTCGRCQVDLQRVVKEIEDRIETQRYPPSPRLRRAGKDTRTQVKIAIMGCEVNGPGEAKEADVGIAFGKGAGALFKKGKILYRIKEKDAVKEILKNI